jgi:hypothetical protein
MPPYDECTGPTPAAETLKRGEIVCVCSLPCLRSRQLNDGPRRRAEFAPRLTGVEGPGAYNYRACSRLWVVSPYAASVWCGGGLCWQRHNTGTAGSTGKHVGQVLKMEIQRGKERHWSVYLLVRKVCEAFWDRLWSTGLGRGSSCIFSSHRWPC